MIKINSQVNDIINFVNQESFSNTQIINTQINLIEYFSQRGFEKKAKKLLTELENNKNYKEKIKLFNERSQTTISARVNLINAKTALNKKEKQKHCQMALNALGNKNNKSIHYTFPLIQAHTCLNREAEIKDLKNSLIKLGINNFEL